jgi:hypothetical protein
MEPADSEQDTETRALAKRLTSRNREERTAAEHILAGLNAEQRHRLVHQLASDVKATKRTSVALLGLLIALAVCWQALRFWMDIEQSSRILVVPMFAVWLAVLTVFLGPMRRQYSALMLALAPSCDPRMLGFIIPALQFPLAQNRSQLREALEKSVAQIGPEDTDLITPKQVRVLAEVMGQRWDAVGLGTRGIAPGTYEEIVLLNLAMVKALAALGTGREMQQLEQLVRKRAKNEGQERIRQAILEVLPHWKARLDGQKDHQSLLRGASPSASSDPPEELLRGSVAEEKRRDL